MVEVYRPIEWTAFPDVRQKNDNEKTKFCSKSWSKYTNCLQRIVGGWSLRQNISPLSFKQCALQGNMSMPICLCLLTWIFCLTIMSTCLCDVSKKLSFQGHPFLHDSKQSYERLTSASLKLQPSGIMGKQHWHSLVFCYSNWQKCPFRTQLMCMTSWTLNQTVHYRNGMHAQNYIQASIFRLDLGETSSFPPKPKHQTCPEPNRWWMRVFNLLLLLHFGLHHLFYSSTYIAHTI